MPIVNLSEPFSVLVTLVLFVLVLLLSREIKKSNITCIMLLIFLTLIVSHCIEYVMVVDPTGIIKQTIAKCIAVDFVFILLSFISYLWIDDIEAKERKIKSIDNGLEWFWKKV